VQKILNGEKSYEKPKDGDGEEDKNCTEYRHPGGDGDDIVAMGTKYVTVSSSIGRLQSTSTPSSVFIQVCIRRHTVYVRRASSVCVLYCE